MTTLYGFRGACSMAPHITLKELNLPHEFKMLDLRGTDSGWKELEKINPLSQVPVLVTDEGWVITEGAAIQYYLVSKKPNDMMPASGLDHWRALEWMNFIGTTLHKGFNPMFSPENYIDEKRAYSGVRSKGAETLKKVMAVAESRMPGDSIHPVAGRFTVVDTYLFTVLSWAKYVKFDLAPYPKLVKFFKKSLERPSVRAVVEAEGVRL